MMISRRGFAKKLSSGVLWGSVAGNRAGGQNSSKTNKLQHVGGDYHAIVCEDNSSCQDWTSKTNFEYHALCGVRHFTNHFGAYDEWDLNHMKELKEKCDQASMVWEAVRMNGDIMKYNPRQHPGKSIERLAGNIEKASTVGVKVITVHWRIHPIMRNEVRIGRGGAECSSFALESDWQSLPPTEHGRVSYEEYWERLSYVLTNIIPVCEEYDVRLATHPYDPPGLPRGYRGIDNWDAAPLSIFDSLKKYEAIVDSPYNGFQLCLGTVMEGLHEPSSELLPIVKYFAEKGKIHQIHMRNIKGKVNDFQECFIDEGEADFIEVVRVLRDTGYQWSICPDHVPKHPVIDPHGFIAFAQAFGYIKSLIDAANDEVTN